MTQSITDKFNALHLTPPRRLHRAGDRMLASRTRLGALLAPVIGVLALAVLVTGNKAPQTATSNVQISAESGLSIKARGGRVDWPARQLDAAEDFDLEYEITLAPESESTIETVLSAKDFDANADIARIHLIEVVDADVEMNDELMCLALNIYFEARSEPLAGKLAVGHVVMNRVSSRNFPETICAVVQQGGERTRYRCQFSWWCDGKSDDPRNASAWDESIKLANVVYKGFSADPTAGALWYHADYVKPKWRNAFERGPKIGRHIFYSKRPARKGTQVASNVIQ